MARHARGVAHRELGHAHVGGGRARLCGAAGGRAYQLLTLSTQAGVRLGSRLWAQSSAVVRPGRLRAQLSYPHPRASLAGHMTVQGMRAGVPCQPRECVARLHRGLLAAPSGRPSQHCAGSPGVQAPFALAPPPCERRIQPLTGHALAAVARALAAAPPVPTPPPQVCQHAGWAGVGRHRQSARRSCTARAAPSTAPRTPPRPRRTGKRAQTFGGRPLRSAPGSAPAHVQRGCVTCGHKRCGAALEHAGSKRCDERALS